MKRFQLYFGLLFSILGSCHNDNDIDYRDQFCGNYDLTIFSYDLHYDGVSVKESFDTINLIASIDKFHGYSLNYGSNYYDVEHKIYILWGDTSNHDYASCNEYIYYIHTSMHPTISNAGVLTYPELTCDPYAYFNGEIVNDSIRILYGFNYNNSMWHKKMIGKKVHY